MAKILDNSGNDRTSDSRPPEDDSGGLGELLRRARERRGLTLQQISNETKIPRRHLEALESDDLTAVPGGFYRRAQLRTFARAVSLDQGIVLARLERMLGAPAAREAVTDTPPAHGGTFSPKLVLIIIGVGVAAAVVGRSIGPLPADRDGQERAAADSHRQVGAQAPESVGDAVPAISQRTPLDVVAPKPAAPDGALTVATKRPELDRQPGRTATTRSPRTRSSPRPRTR